MELRSSHQEHKHQLASFLSNKGDKNVSEVQTTAIKTSNMTIFTQQTPKPVKKILLFGQNNKKYTFPLLRDRDIGIQQKYGNIVIESHNDDDRKTTSTQLEKGMIQTVHDLYQILNQDKDDSQFYSQH